MAEEPTWYPSIRSQAWSSRGESSPSKAFSPRDIRSETPTRVSSVVVVGTRRGC